MREPFGLILAGGRGTRMGGVAKADLMLGEQSLLLRCAERLEPQVRKLGVNTNDTIYSKWDVVPDTMTGRLGPLAGILAGLGWAQSQGASHIVSVAVDTPFFPCDLVPRLLMASKGHEDGLVVAATSDGEHGTFGLWSVEIKDQLAAFLEKGGRKVRDFTHAHNAAIAHFPDTIPPTFFNINTPDDLEQARAWL